MRRLVLAVSVGVLLLAAPTASADDTHPEPQSGAIEAEVELADLLAGAEISRAIDGSIVLDYTAQALPKSDFRCGRHWAVTIHYWGELYYYAHGWAIVDKNFYDNGDKRVTSMYFKALYGQPIAEHPLWWMIARCRNTHGPGV